MDRGSRQRNQCKKTVPENQKEIYSTFTFPTKLLRIHYIIQNGHSEPYDIAVIELHANFPVCLK